MNIPLIIILDEAMCDPAGLKAKQWTYPLSLLAAFLIVNVVLPGIVEIKNLPISFPAVSVRLVWSITNFPL